MYEMRRIFLESFHMLDIEKEQEKRINHAKVIATMRLWVGRKQISADLRFSAGWT